MARPALTLDKITFGSTAMLWAAFSVYQAMFLTHGTFNFFDDIAFGHTFNSMLQHLLQGQFDVDPNAVGGEGFINNGKVYAYFGIFPALLRLVAVPFVDLNRVDLTVLSCFFAGVLTSAANIGSFAMAMRGGNAATARFLLLLLTVIVCLSGQGLIFLKPSLYVEVTDWAGTFGAWFVLVLVIRQFATKKRDARYLPLLASLAGFCLLTRVSTAIGLYGATGVVLLHAAWCDRRIGPVHVVTTLVLAVFVIITGLVNYERWGSPFIFMDLHRNIIYTQVNPSQLVPLDKYGEFSFQRILYGMNYYFVPIWVIHDATGHFLFHDFVERVVGFIEAPPSSLFLTDPLLFALSIVAIRGLRVRLTEPRVTIELAVSLAVPGLLMLMATVMTLRYRMEFYPCLHYLAALGAGLLVRQSRPLSRTPMVLAAILGIVFSHLTLIMFLRSPKGAPVLFERAGWVKGFEQGAFEPP